MVTSRMVNCPRCATRVQWSSDNPWRPFCSEHCKMVDLGAWASERYRIPVVEFDDLDDGLEPPAPTTGSSVN